MVEKVNMFKAGDGRLFDKIVDAALYDQQYNRCCEILECYLNPMERPNDSLYRIRQSEKHVRKGFAEFIKLCKQILSKHDSSFPDESDEQLEKCRKSIVYRILSDYSSDYPFIWKAFSRFMCISTKSWVEYTQPFFACNEDEYDKTVEEFNQYDNL